MDVRPFPLQLQITHLPDAEMRWGLPLDGSINSERYRYGQLSSLAWQVAAIQNTDTPQFLNPHLILLVSDHGIVLEYDGEAAARSIEGVKAASRSQQYVNALCRQNGFTMQLINAGLSLPVDSIHRVLNMAVGAGSSSFLRGDAMTYEQMVRCLEVGQQVVSEAVGHGANVLALGLLSRGARISAAMWASQLADIPIDCSISESHMADWTAGACSLESLTARLREVGKSRSKVEPLYRFGGFDLLVAVGALLQAASKRLTVLIDSFPLLCALYVASMHYPSVVDYVILAHMERTPGMEMLAKRLNIDPVVRLALYASEGIGSLSAYSLIKGALQIPLLGSRFSSRSGS